MVRRPSRAFASASAAALLAVASPLAPSFALAANESSHPVSPPCTATKSLAEILDLVRRGPRAQAASDDAAAVRGQVRQAGSRPNPEISVEVEDFTGSGAYTELGQTQTTISVAQRLELGGVRDRRTDLAEREGRATVARGSEGTLANVVAAKQRFVDVLASAESGAIAAEGEHLARELLAAAHRRVVAGAGSAADEERARIAVAQAGLLGVQARRDEAIARQRLASLWGGEPDAATCLRGSLPRLLPVPDQAPAKETPRSPSVVTAEAEVEAERAAVDFAKASAAPELEIGAGIRHLAGPGEMSAVAGLRVEVPIFDRKDGAIDAAERKLLAAQARAGAAQRETAARRARLAETLAAAAAELVVLDETMLPAAERTWSLLSRAWMNGAASALDVLDARRTLIELRLQRLAVLRDALVTAASLEGTLGRVTETLVFSSPNLRERGAAASKD